MDDASTAAEDLSSTMHPREEAIRELELLLSSAEEVRASVRSTEVRYRKGLKLLKEGIEVSVALDQVHAGSARLSLTKTLASFELARHRTRLALIAFGLAEGMTIGELGRSWGFSRQLASRYAKEARGQSGTSTSTSKESAA
jgi:hypothetical protein